jgi:hypothetical protein
MYLCAKQKKLMSKIVKIGLNIPFQTVEAKIILSLNEKGFLEPRLSMTFSPNVIPMSSKGLYTIYATKDRIDECLYVGESDYCISQRIRRFFKELTGCTNPNEDHPAASKAKRDGYSIDTHTFKVKWISWFTILEAAKSIDIEYNDILLDNLDSAISYFVKSKYNYTTYPLYGYNDATLKEFLGA